MTRTKRLKYFVFALPFFLAACVGLDEFEVERGTDFSIYDSFSVNAAEIPEALPMLPNRVDQAIVYQLTNKGMTRVANDEARLHIRYFLTIDDEQGKNSDDEGTPPPTHGELIVDVRDSQTGDVVWRSRSARELPRKVGNGEALAQSVQMWVNDMIGQYPGP
jgi:hypothetical protein